MRVQLTTDRATLLGIERDGDIVDLPDDEAERMIRRGMAIAVETAVDDRPREDAMLRFGRQSRRKRRRRD